MRKLYSERLSVKNLFKLSFLVSCLFSFSALKAQPGNYLSYDATSSNTQYVTVASGVVSNVTGSFTIEAWVYWRGDAGYGTTWQRVLDFGTNTGNWAAFTVSDPSNHPLFGMQVGGGAVQTVSATSSIPTNTWVHLAVTVDDPTDVATIYINGVNSGSTGGFTYHLSDLGVTTNNYFGRSQFPDPYFYGGIDELRISNNVRYTGNFTTTNLQFASDANTVALYHFNEGSGQTTADASGNGFNGILGATTAVEATLDPTWATGSTLPIRLTEFKVATANNDKAIDVKWTASLDRASDFVIERSNNGVNFSPVGTISRSTGTNGFESFSFRDNTPLQGRSYYRLKCTESGTTPFYSRTVPVMLSSKSELVVYPNPVKGNVISIEIAKPYTGVVEISLSNTSGAIVLKQKINAAEQKEFTISRNASVPAGTYLLEVVVNGEKQSKMIVCQ